MKVDVFSVNFHRESVTLDEEENEIGRSVYGKQSVLMIAPTQDLAIASAMKGVPDAVLDGAQAIVTGAELPEEAIDGVPIGIHDDLVGELKLTRQTLENAKTQNDALTEQIKAANDLLHAAQAKIEELEAQLNQKPVDPPPQPADPAPPAPTV